MKLSTFFIGVTASTLSLSRGASGFALHPGGAKVAAGLPTKLHSETTGGFQEFRSGSRSRTSNRGSVVKTGGRVGGRIKFRAEGARKVKKSRPNVVVETKETPKKATPVDRFFLLSIPSKIELALVASILPNFGNDHSAVSYFFSRYFGWIIYFFFMTFIVGFPLSCQLDPMLGSARFLLAYVIVLFNTCAYYYRLEYLRVPYGPPV